jgi:lipopolysaccharide assembly outer membrane protein LptD (OstA)
MMLLCVLCFSVFYAETLSQQDTKKPQRKHTTQRTRRPADYQAPDKKRIYLVHADELSYDRWRNNNAQVLNGNVEFEHDGARLLCDSANFFEHTNSFEAFGHVRMYQGDTLSLTSDYGYYDGNDQMMEAFQQVSAQLKN